MMIWLWFLLGYLLVMFITYIICTYETYRNSCFYRLKLTSEFFDWYIDSEDFGFDIVACILWPISLMTIIIVAIGSRVIKSIFKLLDKIFNRGTKTR